MERSQEVMTSGERAYNYHVPKDFNSPKSQIQQIPMKAGILLSISKCTAARDEPTGLSLLNIFHQPTQQHSIPIGPRISPINLIIRKAFSDNPTVMVILDVTHPCTTEGIISLEASNCRRVEEVF
jgi:hypothetical protein